MMNFALKGVPTNVYVGVNRTGADVFRYGNAILTRILTTILTTILTIILTTILTIILTTSGRTTSRSCRSTHSLSSRYFHTKLTTLHWLPNENRRFSCFKWRFTFYQNQDFASNSAHLILKVRIYIQNDEYSLQNDEFCIQNNGFCTCFWRSAGIPTSS